jgi:hypothetical protein
VDSGTPPTYAAGPASNFQLQHTGHAFNLQSQYQDMSVGFRTQLGFIQTSNFHNGQTHMTYQWYPKHRLIQSYGLETNLLDRDHAVANGALVYESQVFRTKVNYQFTRAISARVIAEYDSTLADPAETSLKRTKQVGTEALLTWLPHPGTAVYLGYNDDVQNLDRSQCNRLPGGGCDPNNTVAPRATNLLNDGRQIFIKASYLLRF